ncbi:hypothetical protein F0562_035558 [Nyssa sinensis]|uniref:Uncharacterized protein n=1 Tax=Nyssa sinensis TaxID=561372 RepID=A0A5J5AGB2_9ASTE|nr:hypothetical protein F0562_035558 [Nyssa sinensis]
MLGKKGPGVAVESSALVAANANSSKVITHQRRNDGQLRVWCDYCNKPRHTRETCWKIQGKPANWKSSKPGDRSSRVFPTANEAEVSPFTKEQMEHLLTLLKSNSSSGIPSVSLAQTGVDQVATEYPRRTGTSELDEQKEREEGRDRLTTGHSISNSELRKDQMEGRCEMGLGRQVGPIMRKGKGWTNNWHSNRWRHGPEKEVGPWPNRNHFNRRG